MSVAGWLRGYQVSVLRLRRHALLLMEICASTISDKSSDYKRREMGEERSDRRGKEIEKQIKLSGLVFVKKKKRKKVENPNNNRDNIDLLVHKKTIDNHLRVRLQKKN